MSFTPGGHNDIGEIEYDKEIERWCALNSKFLNEKTHLSHIKFINTDEKTNIQVYDRTNKWWTMFQFTTKH